MYRSTSNILLAFPQSDVPGSRRQMQLMAGLRLLSHRGGAQKRIHKIAALAMAIVFGPGPSARAQSTTSAILAERCTVPRSPNRLAGRCVSPTSPGKKTMLSCRGKISGHDAQLRIS